MVTLDSQAAPMTRKCEHKNWGGHRNPVRTRELKTKKKKKSQHPITGKNKLAKTVEEQRCRLNGRNKKNKTKINSQTVG